jgi:Zn-dependent M28 family amino/carboxypeptidase
VIAPALSLIAPLPAGAQKPATPIQRERLEKHVRTLASPEYQGRRGAGAVKAAEYVLAEFRAASLAPLFEDGYTQDVPMPKGEGVRGRNLGARLVGSDPDLRDEWVVLAAHYDHLGTYQGHVFAGADDNASGVAMLIEVARAMAASPERPRRSVMFVSFDLEEEGLVGSKYFVDHPPVPIEKIVMNLTADMIGRSLRGICEPYMFVLGSETSPAVRPWVEAASPGEPWKVAMLGSDLLVVPRSDYGPFKARRVPYLFFSTGEDPTYHTPADVPETLNYDKLRAVSNLIAGVTRQAANADEAPAWSDEREHAPGEASAMRYVFQKLLDHKDNLKIGPSQLVMLQSSLPRLDEIVARGGFQPAERRQMLRVAQIILMTVP